MIYVIFILVLFVKVNFKCDFYFNVAFILMLFVKVDINVIFLSLMLFCFMINVVSMLMSFDNVALIHVMVNVILFLRYFHD